MTLDFTRMNTVTKNELMKIIVHSRRITLIYFFAPIISVISIVAVVSIFPVFKRPYFPTLGLIPFFLFLFLYMGVTSLLALAWTLFGKDSIIIDQKGIQVDRVLFFKFSSRHYQRDKIFNIYVNSRDYEVTKISRGRNDFLSVFRFGTIHFYYDGKLQHIAGGMTDEEGQTFLANLNIHNQREKETSR